MGAKHDSLLNAKPVISGNSKPTDRGQEYTEWIYTKDRKQRKLIASENAVLLISNPFEAIYASYATVVGTNANRNYNYQFFGIGRAGTYFFIFLRDISA